MRIRWWPLGLSIIACMFLLASPPYGFPVGFLPFGFFLVGGCWLAWWGRVLDKVRDAEFEQLYQYLEWHRRADQ